MAYAFLLVIITFAIVAAVYQVRNDFARETLEVLFPAIGAILLSFYLGSKSIWLDRPAPMEFGTTVAVVHDAGAGTVRGTEPRGLHHLAHLEGFKGARLISKLPLYNAFKAVPMREILADSAPGERDPATELILDLLEYAVLTWLADPSLAPGFQSTRPMRLVTSSGGGGNLLGHLRPINVESGDATPNPFLRARPLELLLPSGSSVERWTRPRKIVVRTKHSRVEFSIQKRGWQSLDDPVGPEAERIYNELGLPPEGAPGLSMHGFAIEVVANQEPFTRFSEQAKIEAKWINTLEQRLDEDFSWERLRSLYASP